MSYAELVFKNLGGRFVEVYVGSSSTTRMYADFNTFHKEVIRGVLIKGEGDLLVLEVTDNRGNKNQIYVNCWNTTTVIELKDHIDTSFCFWDDFSKDK